VEEQEEEQEEEQQQEGVYVMVAEFGQSLLLSHLQRVHICCGSE
jgi:hypothetical protein